MFQLLLMSLFFASVNGQAKFRNPFRTPSWKKNQIGPHWDRVKVTAQEYEKLTKLQKEIVRSVATIFTPDSKKTIGISHGSLFGTVFYIGKYSGEYVFMSAGHIISSQKECSKVSISFYDYVENMREKKAFNKKIPCKKILDSQVDIKIQGPDYSLFTIQNDHENVGYFENLPGLKLDWTNKNFSGDNVDSLGFTKGVSSSFVTAGFGVADYKLIRIVNLSVAKRHMYRSVMATSCEVAGGDSGSSLLKSGTASVIGLITNVGNLQHPRKKDDDFVDWLLSNNHREDMTSTVFSNSSIAYSVKFIRDMISNRISNGRIKDQSNVLMLKEIFEII